ncbi:MAG TPA: hypothetical protein VMM18_12665 [Gemmatimonadaceae bacterium]|nr:hypothetical protein [Gemmatimonadaceae bacterium]
MRRLADGSERALAEVREAHSLAWSLDGAWIAYVSGNAIAFLPALFGNVASSRILVVPASGGTPVLVTDDSHQNISPAWLPDGRLLFVSNRGGTNDVYLLALRSDGVPAGKPLRLTTGLGAVSITASADGRTLAYSTLIRRQNVWSLAIPSSGIITLGGARPITTGNQVIEGMAISPDGEWLAFDSDRAGNQDLYKVPLAGGDIVQLTHHPADEFVNSWSADRQWLAGHGFRRGNRDLFIVRSDGSDFQFVALSSSHDRLPNWSPDGRRIAFLSERAGRSRNLFVTERNPDGEWSEPRQLTFNNAPWWPTGSPRWSPDGSWIAYVAPQSIRIVRGDGGDSRVIAQGPSPIDPVGVAWSANGESIIYIGHDSTGAFGFWTAPLSGGRPRLLVRFDSPDDQVRGGFIVHEDRLYFTRGQFDGDAWVLELRATR